MLTTRPGRRTALPVMDRRLVPLQIAAGAVGQAAAAHAVLAGQGRQRADGPHVLAAVAIAVDAVGDLDEAGPHRPRTAAPARRCRPRPARSSAATRSGGNSASRSRSCGQPTVCAFSQASSCSPSATRTWAMPSARAPSVPGRGARCQSAPSGRCRAPRVDDDDLTARALGLAQERHEVRRRADRVVAPEDDELAVNARRRRAGSSACRAWPRRPARRRPRRCCARAGWPRAGSRGGRWRRSSAPGRACRCSCTAGSPRRPSSAMICLPAAGDLGEGLVPGDALPLAGRPSARRGAADAAAGRDGRRDRDRAGPWRRASRG